MDIDWYDLDEAQLIATLSERLDEEHDEETIEDLVVLLREVAEGDSEDSTLHTRLEGGRLLLALFRRELDQRSSASRVRSARDEVLTTLSEDHLGPRSDEAVSLLLRSADRSTPASNIIHDLNAHIPSPALAAQAAALAEHADPDEALYLRAFAARGHPQHHAALLAHLDQHAETINWTHGVPIRAVAELGVRAAHLLPRIADPVREGRCYDTWPHLLLGDALLPYLSDAEDERALQLIAQLEAPWEHLEDTFSAVCSAICTVPSLWPDLTALLKEEPDLLDPEDENGFYILSAVAFGRLPADDLLPALIEASVAHEAWVTLLVLGPAALPAIEAHLNSGSLDEEARGWLSQVRDRLAATGTRPPGG